LRVFNVNWLAGRSRSGLDVILENGFWSCKRDEYRTWARRLGARVKLHFLNVPRDELWARLSRRNANPSQALSAFAITNSILGSASFEAPTAAELADNGA